MAFRIQVQPDETFVVTDQQLMGESVGDPDVTYTLRRLSVAKVRELYDKHKREALARNTDINTMALQDDQLDYVLVGWTGMVGNTNEPLPCEKVYKIGDLSQGILGLPVDRRPALLREAQKAVKVSEDKKRQSFRAPEDVRAVSEA